MTISQLVKSVETREEFIDWKDNHPESFLAHIFTEEEKGHHFQLGYFDPEANTIATFEIKDDELTVIPDNEYLKSDKIIALDLHAVQKTPAEAWALVFGRMKESYSKEVILKQFMIIQMIKGKATFNITFFTRTFKTVNFKLSATTGEVLDETSAPLMDLGGLGGRAA